ncbi:MAG: MATE family efflux transporter [Gammaproteobacteria bacterium]|nr:MAG: MATE family efflux transporter [Gammaproteobacteria bacterium]
MKKFLADPANKNESKEMLKLATPAIIAQVAQMSMGAIDTIMAGNLSTSALAAISVGSNLFVPLLVFSMGIIMSLNPLVAQANGAGRYNKVGEYFRHGIYIAIVVAIPTIFLMYQLKVLMQIIGVQPSIIPVVTGYLEALAWGVIPLFLFFVLRSLNEGLFSTKVIMYISLTAIPFNIALNYIFMYGYLGMPTLGAIGLGYATSVVWCLILTILLVYTIFTPKYKHLIFFKHFHKPQVRVFKEILKLGLPLSATIGLEVLMFGAVGLFIGRYSIETIAAHQIAMNLSSLAYMFPLGLSVAISARVGHAIGRHSYDGVKRASYIGLGYSVFFSLCSIFIALLFTAQLVEIYTDQVQVIDLTIKLIYIATLFMIFDGFQVATASALRGMKDTFVPMFLSGISYWLIGFPVGYYLAEVVQLQAAGYWFGFIAGLATAAILLIFRLQVVLKRLASDRSFS